MFSIRNAYQILTVSAGSEKATVVFEIQTTHATPKRIMVQRKSEFDPNIYFMNHAAITALLPFIQDEVVAMYENTWPTDLPSLGSDGQLSSEFNAKFAQADFAKGKTGLVSFNGYDYRTGSFVVAKSTAASADDTNNTAATPWYKTTVAKVLGYGSLALGALALVVALFRKK